MSARLRSSKRTRGQRSGVVATPETRGKRGKRSSSRQGSNKAATVPAAATIAERQPSWCLDGEAEKVVLKVEPLDLTSDVEEGGLPYDVKPDVQELQQLYLQQQQQQHAQQLQQQQQQQLSTMTPLGGESGPLPNGGKRVYIIGDLAMLTSLANSTNTTALRCLAGGADESGGATTSATAMPLPLPSGGAIQLTPLQTATVQATPTPAGMQATGPARATMTVTPSALPIAHDSKAKTVAVDFVKDEFDLQHSDIEDDGYSDVELEEDDDFVEEEGDYDVYDPTWRETATAPRLVFPFESSLTDIGLEGKPKATDPAYYFGKMLANIELFFSLLATGANERLHALIDEEANSVPPQLRAEITSEELRCFIGLCLQMSTLQLPTLADYWSKQAHYGFDGFASAMSEPRFRLLMRTLNFEHIGPPQTAYKPNDPLANVMPLIEFFNHRMTDIWKCSQRLVLNDPIVFWKGRCQWLRDMSERFRCNAVTMHLLTEYTGLVLRIVPDVEREERRHLTRESKQLAQYRAGLSMQLLRHVLDQGHTVYTSKYYSSCGLANELATKRTYSTGLLDSKRYGNCKHLMLTPLDNRAFATRYASALMMGKWRHKEKCVYFCSSDTLAIYANEIAWRAKDPRPKIIRELQWQLQMPGNVRGAMVQYQLCFDRNDIKWDKQLAIYMFNLMLLNAYTMYLIYAPIGRSRVGELHLKDTTQLKTFGEFRQCLIRLLVTGEQTSPETSDSDMRRAGGAPKSKRQQRKREAADVVEADSVGDAPGVAHLTQLSTAAAAAAVAAAAAPHRPSEIPRRAGKVLKKKCRVCRKSGMLTYSKHCCERCAGMPGLCEEPCFDIWHDTQRRNSRSEGVSPGGRIRVRNFDEKAGKSGIVVDGGGGGGATLMATIDAE